MFIWLCNGCKMSYNMTNIRPPYRCHFCGVTTKKVNVPTGDGNVDYANPNNHTYDNVQEEISSLDLRKDGIWNPV